MAVYHLDEEMRRGKEVSFPSLQTMASQGTSLFYQGKKVVIDPFSRVKFFIQVSWVSQQEALFCPFWELKELQVPFSDTSLIIEEDPCWLIHAGILRPFKNDVPKMWIAGQKTITGSLIFERLSMLQKEGIEVREIGQEKRGKSSPLPFLVLADRHGAFADLWFDYGPFGVVARHDPSALGFRNEEEEKGWERDLQEAGFCKKQVGESHYYCALDQVVKTLRFLLEIGWKILDRERRQLAYPTKIDLAIEEVAGGFHLEGSLLYGKNKLDLSKTIQALKRQEKFLPLGSSEVALIDRDFISSSGVVLEEEEITEKGVFIRSSCCGALAPLLSSSSVSIAGREKLQVLLKREVGPALSPGTSFQGVLFPYQQRGFEWLSFLGKTSLGGVLADEMGLGKTVQILAFFSSLKKPEPILVVTPTSLVFNWAREIEKFLPSMPIYRHEGKERVMERSVLEQKPLILISYALLRQEIEMFQGIHFQVIVLDEAQVIKNKESQISKAVYSLSSDIRIAVTGTPVENRQQDLWSLFHFIQRDVLGDYKQFQQHLASPIELIKMKHKITPFILRRTKKEVAIDLPEKIEQTICVEMTSEERQLYDRYLQKAKQGVLRQVAEGKLSLHRMEVLEVILRLRQICAHPLLVASDPFSVEGSKFERVFSDLQEVIEEGGQVIVYSQFTKMLRLIEEEVQKRGWDYVYLDGETKNREEVVSRFQKKGGVPLFLMSLKAGGVGLNLTQADYVFLYEPWWNEAVEAQAIDRAHRLGRQSPVIARRYIASCSIEEKMMLLKEHKKGLFHSLLQEDVGEMASLSVEEILSLFD